LWPDLGIIIVGGKKYQGLETRREKSGGLVLGRGQPASSPAARWSGGGL